MSGSEETMPRSIQAGDTRCISRGSCAAISFDLKDRHSTFLRPHYALFYLLR